MIIRKIGFLVCMLVVCSLNINTAMAQSRSYEGVITVNPVRLEQKGDFIHVDIDFVLNNVKVKSARGMDFIPRLVTPGRTQNLPKVSIKGRDEYLAYERELALMNAKEKRNYEKPYIVEKAGKLRNDTIRYQYLVPFESWMKDARLDVQRDECGCGETALMNIEEFGKVTLERVWTPYVVVPQFAYLQPKAEEIKQRDIQAECFLDFEVNKVNIRPEYMNNPQELAKIRKMIDELKSDPNVKVNRLDIIGYASPKEHWQRTNVCLKGVLWRFGIIWHTGTIFRETNTTLSLEVKTGTDWRKRLKQSNWNIKTKCWILSGTYLLKKEEKQN